MFTRTLLYLLSSLSNSSSLKFIVVRKKKSKILGLVVLFSDGCVRIYFVFIFSSSK